MWRVALKLDVHFAWNSSAIMPTASVLRTLLDIAVLALVIACRDTSGPSNSPATVVAVSGDAQPASEVGSKLALPLVVKVSDAQGQSLTGVTVAWSTSSGTLSASSSVTDANGVATMEWILGLLAGSQSATATVTGLKPVIFTEIAIAGPLAQIILTRDTVRLLGIGDVFQLRARAADQFGNTVPVGTTVVSADTSVVTADNFGEGAILTARTSDKTTTVRATAEPIVKIGTVIVLPPPCQSGANAFNLAVGEAALLSGTAASEFCVQGTSAGAEFIAIPFYSDFSGSLLRLSISTGNTTIGVSLNRLAPSLQPLKSSDGAQPTKDE